MGAGLAIEVQELDEMSYLRLSGVFMGGQVLAEVAERLSSDVVVINPADVTRINSAGVRDWVHWMEQLEQKGCSCYLVECSPAIMTHVNYFDRFVGSGRIVSFYAPYFCPTCDTDKELLIDVDEALQSMPFSAPAYRCDRCDQALEFDEFESSYFAFLSTVNHDPLDPALSQSIAPLSAKTRLRDFPTSK